MQDKYYSVQMLRGFAALFVVIVHITNIIILKMDESFPKFSAGGAGVDIFFAISGFVIFLTYAASEERKTPQSWHGFLLRRIVRVAPLYWFLTLFKATLLLIKPDLATDSYVDFPHLVSSLLFLPEYDTMPLVQVGWTLQYEMFFYILFAATIAFRIRPLIPLTIIFAVLGLMNGFEANEHVGRDAFFNPLFLEFVFGLWIGFITVKGWRMPEKIAYIMIPVTIIAILATLALPVETAHQLRLFLWGIPGALLLLSVIALEKKYHKYLVGIPNLLGDASYAIYLTHPFVLPIVIVIFTKLGLHGMFFNIFALLLCFFASIAAGIITHIWVEKPVSAYLKRAVSSKKYAK